MDQKKRLVWFILVRVVVVTLFFLSTIILNIREPESMGGAAFAGFTKLIVATYLFSFGSLAVLKLYHNARHVLTTVQIVWDLILVTLLLLLTGGISSPFAFLYVLSITNASFLLGRREAVYTASLCAILYGAIVDLQYYGRLDALGLNAAAAHQHGSSHLFYTVFINIVVFYLTAFVTGYLAERAISTEALLHEKDINYEELERLYSLIVSNLGSGVITLNRDGNIRVFNTYAAHLLGISLKDAYDRPLLEILPELGRMASVARAERHEVVHVVDRRKYILDVKLIPFSDKKGDAAILVHFEDLTQIKRMEAELKKTDRLAAVGELSAHIAHEIRNPLASISGSVQLISEGATIDARDRKLLEIVVRETDRLNVLIGAFLAYARPLHPVKVPLHLCQFLTDLDLLLKQDPRFQYIRYEIVCPGDVMLDVDRDQFQQVFWNLLVNAAEAMPEGGTITVAAEVVSSDRIGTDVGDMIRIDISDTGIGMTKDDIEKVFEPFFTTKQGGTGLGMATVYRIIESHEGVIVAESEKGNGTTFTCYLPAHKKDKG